MAIELSATTPKTMDQIRRSFRHGTSYEKLDKLVAYFVPGGYLSAYGYRVVETKDNTTVFDVFYNPETHTAHDTHLELDLVFRSLGLKVS